MEKLERITLIRTNQRALVRTCCNMSQQRVLKFQLCIPLNRFNSVRIGMAYQYTAEPVGMPGAYTGVPYTTGTFGGYSGYSMPMAASGLDHSQGKWFAPGEALPPGFVVTSHPDGHTAPQESHAMSDKARESFVITAGSAAAAVGSAVKTGSSALTSKKKSKKKKSSGCC